MAIQTAFLLDFFSQSVLAVGLFELLVVMQSLFLEYFHCRGLTCIAEITQAKLFYLLLLLPFDFFLCDSVPLRAFVCKQLFDLAEWQVL